jgi:hypothetical protein
MRFQTSAYTYIHCKKLTQFAQKRTAAREETSFVLNYHSKRKCDIRKSRERWADARTCLYSSRERHERYNNNNNNNNNNNTLNTPKTDPQLVSEKILHMKQ